MTYTSPGWVDVLPGTTAPPGAPALDAANLQLLTDAVAALSGGGLGGFTFVGPKTASYPPNPGEFVLWDTTSGSLVQTLPPAPADKTIIGAKIVVLGTGHTVTVNCSGSDVFNKAGGGTSLVLSLVDQAVQLEYIAATSVWVVTGIDLSLSQLDARYNATYVPLPTRVAATGNVAAALGQTIACDTSGGTFTVTIPAASGGKGTVTVKWTAGTVPPTIALSGSDHTNTSTGATSFSPVLLNQGYQLQSDGTSIWTVVSDDLPLSLLDARYAPPSDLGTPAEHGGLFGWSMHPYQAIANVSLTTQRVQFQRIRWLKTQTVGNLYVYINTGGSGLTSGQSIAALYTGAGVRIGSASADQSAAFTSAGLKPISLGGLSVPADPTGWIYAAVLSNGTTPPQLRGAVPPLTLATIGYSGSQPIDCGFDVSTGNTVLPGTINPAFNSASAADPIFVALGP